MNKLPFVVAAAAGVLLAGVVAPIAPANEVRPAQVTALLIQEIKTHGSTAATPTAVDPDDEFIKILDPSADNIAVGDMTVDVCSGDGVVVSSFANTGVIDAGEFYTVAHPNSTVSDPDQVESLLINSNSGFRHSNSAIGSIDAVGLGDHNPGSGCIEPPAAPSVPSNVPNSANLSTQRDPAGADADVSAVVFVLAQATM